MLTVNSETAKFRNKNVMIKYKQNRSSQSLIKKKKYLVLISYLVLEIEKKRVNIIKRVRPYQRQ